MGKIFVGQSALRITLNTFCDLTGTEKVIIKYRKPNRKQGEFTAAVSDAENGKIIHECLEGEIDVSGWWAFWAFVTFADGRTAAGEAAKVYIWEIGK